MAGNDDLIARLRDADAWAGLLNGGSTVLEEAATALAERDVTIERLEKENEELRDAPWPEWATAVLKVIREHSGYDGYDDALDGVDLPSELEELMSELEQQAERNLAEARAEREVEQHKASTDHYRLKASEQRARAETAERERDEARSEVERLKQDVKAARSETSAVAKVLAYEPPYQASLAKRVEGLVHWKEVNETEIARLKAEVERKDAALAPFADMADYIDAETEGVSDTDELEVMFHDLLFARWPISHFRTARAALTAKGGADGAAS